MTENFRAKEEIIEGEIHYVFPASVTIDEAWAEMIDFASQGSFDKRLTFYAQGQKYIMEMSLDKEALQKKYSSEHAVLIDTLIRRPHVRYDGNRLIYESEISEPVETSILLMRAIADDYQIDVIAGFDSRLIVEPGSKRKEVLSRYLLELMASDPLAAELPEVQEYLEEKEKKARERTEKFNELLECLPDFADMERVISWLEDVSDCLDSSLPGERVVEIFAQHGFPLDSGTGGKFQQEDEKGYAGWVIGQMLLNIRNSGKIYPRVRALAGRWRKKFKHPKTG